MGENFNSSFQTNPSHYEWDTKKNSLKKLFFNYGRENIRERDVTIPEFSARKTIFIFRKVVHILG